MKQLLAALIVIGKPCPEKIREQIEDDFGAANRQPSTSELVEDILVPLLATFSNVIIIIDGVDTCELREQAELWMHLRKVLSNRHLRIAISSQDDTNVTGHMAGFLRIPIDDRLNAEDIDTYIENQLALKSGAGQIFSDSALRTKVKQTIQGKAQGMYVPGSVGTFQSRFLTDIGSFGCTSCWT